ncbi:MAG: flagellar hook-associated protein FlgK [Phycisphaerae bacterium]|nr:flagellar hook-associated protein FlgK [Phycisphaerae bacterium]
MGLNGALQIGQSALMTSQAAIQVAGNNMANAATPGYHRQVASIVPARDDRVGFNSFVGTGVRLRDIGRVVDTALQSRIRSAISRESGTSIDQRFLSSIESLQNELTDNDLSTRLSEFFNSFSELSNNPNDDAVRSVVLRQASGIAGHINSLRGEYVAVRSEVDRSLAASIEAADGLLGQIAAINAEITQVEQGAAQANGLRDRRDALVDELSSFLDISTVEQANGALDVFVGSLPIVLAGDSRGIELRTTSNNGETEVQLRISSDGSTLTPEDGSIGALFRQRAETVDPAIDTLDTFTTQFIYQVNKIHSQGQGKAGWTNVTGLVRLASATDALNADATEAPFRITNGSFKLHVTNTTTGLRESAQILIDPSTMSLTDVVTAINAAGLSNVTASVTSNNSLRLVAAGGYELSFSDDSSGAMAGLGVNALFGGSDASDIELNEIILNNPELLATAKDHVEGSNGAALDMVALQDLAIADLGNRSLRGYWLAAVNDHAVRTSAANDEADGAGLVRQSLEAQAQAVSGVSVDEEAIDLLSFQRQFQAAARYITVIDEAMQTLLSIA